MHRERIVAVGLLTQRNLDQLGDSLERLWPVDKCHALAPYCRPMTKLIDRCGENEIR
jgi:hypothetical protein